MYISLSCIQSLQQVFVQVSPYFTPLRHLRPMKTALLRAQTLQKLSLAQECQVPPPGPGAYVVCCATLSMQAVFSCMFTNVITI